jgi:hypothetical protein
MHYALSDTFHLFTTNNFGKAIYFKDRPLLHRHGGMALRGTWTVCAPAAPAISSPRSKKNTNSDGVIAKFW